MTMWKRSINNKICYLWRCPRCGALMTIASSMSSYCPNCNTLLVRDTEFPSKALD